ncbi:MAG TPA: ATP-binding protein [Micromonosporaceae bacterium]|nr:ATP-binding protein [Micromonosporaceae bacterium]
MSQTVPEAAIEGDVVVLVVPADNTYLAVLRTATAGLAARLQMTLDQIEDLRIAVDEACAILVPLATADARAAAEVTCRFSVMPEALRIDVSVATPYAERLPGNQSFSWQVLTALAGEVTAEAADGRATISLTKRRAG